jgi:hypothetical protein
LYSIPQVSPVWPGFAPKPYGDVATGVTGEEQATVPPSIRIVSPGLTLLHLIALSSFQAFVHELPVVLLPLRDTYQVEPDAVGDGVAVALGVFVTVPVRVGVAVLADVAVELLVAVGDGEAEAVGVAVGEDVGVVVGRAVLVRVDVGDAVADDVDVLVAVATLVFVGVAEGV